MLASLGDQLDALVDVTLAYPGGDATMWQFVCGRIDTITLRGRRIEIPPEFFTAAITEPGPSRDRFKAWIESTWREKDALMSEERRALIPKTA